MKKKFLAVCVSVLFVIPVMGMEEDILYTAPIPRLNTKKTLFDWLMSIRVSPEHGNDQKSLSHGSECDQQKNSLFPKIHWGSNWFNVRPYFQGAVDVPKSNVLENPEGSSFQQSERREVGHVHLSHENVAFCSDLDDVSDFLVPRHVIRVNSATDSSISITVDGSIISEDGDGGKNNRISKEIVDRLHAIGDDEKLSAYQEEKTYADVIIGCQNKKAVHDNALSKQQMASADCKKHRITFYQKGTPIKVKQVLTNYIIDQLKTIFFPEEFSYRFKHDLKHIWILDDSPVQLKMAVLTLTRIIPDFTIQKFSHVSKAMAYLKDEKILPYAVITDLHMGEPSLDKLVDDTKHEEKKLREGVFLALFLRHVGFRGLITAVTSELFDQINFIRQTFPTLPNEIPLFDDIRGKILDDTRHTLMLDYSRDAITGLLCETDILFDLG